MTPVTDAPNVRARQQLLFDEQEAYPAETKPIAGICTLASSRLLAQLQADPEISERALIGPLTTENLGIEKLIRTVVHEPSIRFLILCGQEARGHYGGQAVQALLAEGVDGGARIIGARGPRPSLANLAEFEIAQFRRQVTHVDLIGCEDAALVRSQLQQCIDHYPGPYEASDTPEVASQSQSVYEVSAAYDPYRDWVRDPAGFFVVTIERESHRLKCEHYTNGNVLHAVIRGGSAAELLFTIVQYELVSRLDHAAYLGRELQKAELALMHGLSYEQDASLSIPSRS